MRVVSGEYRGRKLKSVPGINTRPTTDKIKEALFNRIGPYFMGGNMLDMYAGSGAIGIEAVSRGMDHAVLIEKNRQALQTIRSNIAVTKEPEKFTLLAGNTKQKLKELQSYQFEFVFLDPPYAEQTIVSDIRQLQDLDLLIADAVIVAEVDHTVQLSERIGQFVCEKKALYGTTALYIYRKEGE